MNSNSDFVKYFFVHCLEQQSSVMYKSLSNIANNLNLTLDSLLRLNKSELKKLLSNNEIVWKSDLIKELLLFREGQLYSNLNKNEINILLNEICTN